MGCSASVWHPSVPKWLGKTHWVEAGPLLERLPWQIDALGIRTAISTKPVEVSSLRPQFSAFLRSWKPQAHLVVRSEEDENAEVAAPT